MGPAAAGPVCFLKRCANVVFRWRIIAVFVTIEAIATGGEKQSQCTGQEGDSRISSERDLAEA